MTLTHCVYWIRHEVHKDIMTQGYVGVTNNFSRRLDDYKKGRGNRHLSFAIKKYGWGNLVKTEIFSGTCEECLSEEKRLRPDNEIGWNLIAGGGKPPIMIGPQPHLVGKRTAWNKGVKMSAETRAKISAAAKRQMANSDMRELLASRKRGKASPLRGRKQSAETIQKMSEALRGRPSKKKGRKTTGQALINVQEASRISWVCPICGKEGKGRGAANRWHFGNCKQVMAA